MSAPATSNNGQRMATPFAWRNNTIDAVEAVFALQRQNLDFATRIWELNLGYLGQSLQISKWIAARR